MNQVAQVIEHQAPAIVPNNTLTPMAMLEAAVNSGAGIEVIGRLMDFQERWDANQARKAFDAAMAAAKAELPVIRKNREVDFTSQKGRTNYRHEDLAGIASQIDPILTRHGLSYRFRPTQGEGGLLTVTCILSHKDGHSEESSLSAGRDESGNKNNHQAIGSAATYLQRYTLKMALGLAASNDDDAKGASAAPSGPITDEQAANITQMLTDTKSNVDLFLKWIKAESVSDIHASQYQKAIDRLEAKRKQS
jgi:hypothetical protein